MKKIAVVLFNLGGPDQLSSVKKFLFNLFFDPAIIDLPKPFRYLLAKLISSARNKKAMGIYKLIGNKSPILEITTNQAEALEKELSFYGSYKVFVSMRYWHPMSDEVIEKLRDYNPEQIILLPLYPQFSTTTTGSSLKDFYQKLSKSNLTKEVKYICCYPVNDGFISAHVGLVKQAITKAKNAGYSNYRLLFSAHGLPKKVIDQGDSYVWQIITSTKAIIAELEKDPNLLGLGTIDQSLDYKICYQSKVGPLEWTSPSLDFEIRRAAVDKKPVIIVPISFVSDHSETLVELDIQYQEMAANLGIPYYLRVSSLNLDGCFIKALSDICHKTSNSNLVCNGGNSGSRLCPDSFKKCPNTLQIISKITK